MIRFIRVIRSLQHSLRHGLAASVTELTTNQMMRPRETAVKRAWARQRGVCTFYVHSAALVATFVATFVRGAQGAISRRVRTFYLLKDKLESERDKGGDKGRRGRFMESQDPLASVNRNHQPDRKS